MRNEAAERLLRQIRGWVKVNSGALAHAEANLSDALATERRNTAERIWDAFENGAVHDNNECHSALRLVLDEVAGEKP